MQDSHSAETAFKIKRKTLFSKVMSAYAKQYVRPLLQVAFVVLELGVVAFGVGATAGARDVIDMSWTRGSSVSEPQLTSDAQNRARHLVIPFHL